MRACARVVAEPDGRGGTRLATLRGEPPLLLRQTGPTEVYLIGGAAGPLGGDDLRLEIEVHPGAVLHLRASAASMALPALSGVASRCAVAASVGGVLHYLPEQLIAGGGCRHEALSTVEVHDGGAVVWREELICGRYAEQPGDVTVRLDVRYAGRPLLRQSLSVGPDAPGWSGAAVLGGARASGSLVCVGPSVEPGGSAVLGDTAVRVPLPGPGWLTTATAANAHELRGYLAGPN